MYCSKCGEELPDDAKFCMSCGTRMSSSGDYAMHWRDPTTATLYSFLVIGAGQMYVGAMRRGIAMLLCALSITVALAIAMLVATEDDFFELTAMIMFAALLFALWIVNIFDAYNLARFSNNHLMDTGKPPELH